jgi:hypothetical protein
MPLYTAGSSRSCFARVARSVLTVALRSSVAVTNQISGRSFGKTTR